MEDRVEIALLMDYYSALLTEKQKSVMEMYYEEDLSLAEIAELNNTSRQAIHDLIKRCYKQLLSYESKLNLLQKSINREKMIIGLVDELRNRYSITKEECEEFKSKLNDL
ncbi:MAG: putative DNA-binding protein [Clostridium sp.]